MSMPTKDRWFWRGTRDAGEGQKVLETDGG